MALNAFYSDAYHVRMKWESQASVVSKNGPPAVSGYSQARLESGEIWLTTVVRGLDSDLMLYFPHICFLCFVLILNQAFEDFIENAESEIPTRSRDDIIQHDEWYREYLTLREHKRIAIAKWKDLKEVSVLLYSMPCR